MVTDAERPNESYAKVATSSHSMHHLTRSGTVILGSDDDWLVTSRFHVVVFDGLGSVLELRMHTQYG